MLPGLCINRSFLANQQRNIRRTEAAGIVQERQEARSLHSEGYITLAKIKQKVRFNITDEMQDTQRRLNSLATALQALAPGDPERTPIIQEMMEISGTSRNV